MSKNNKIEKYNIRLKEYKSRLLQYRMDGYDWGIYQMENKIKDLEEIISDFKSL